MLQEAAMDYARFPRRMILVLCGAGLLFTAWAQPVSAQAYYACPPGYSYAEPGSCVPSGFSYGQPYLDSPFYYGVAPFGFGGGFNDGFDHRGFDHRGFDHRGFGHEGFGHEGFAHGGSGFGHGGGHR
jgi:hypothetical protein